MANTIRTLAVVAVTLIVGCTMTVRYRIPVTPTARVSIDQCERSPDPGACLRGLPGAVEEDRSCASTAARPGETCVERRKSDGSSTALLAGLIVIGVAVGAVVASNFADTLQHSGD